MRKKMKIEVEIETKKSFYRLNSGGWRKCHFWRYYKRREAQGSCWLIWRLLFGYFDIECYAWNKEERE